MRKLLFLILSIFAVHAEASPFQCTGEFKGASARIEAQYDQSQYLGLAIPDHDNRKPFDHLKELLQSRGLDPALKTISVEVPAEFGNPYEQPSPSGMHPQDVYFKNEVLPLIEQINAKRPHDPLVVIGIDSVTREKVMSMFPQSIDREQGTSLNFQRMVYAAYPGRKGIIIYHQAHILRDLIAVGIDEVGTENIERQTHLGWINFAFDAIPSLRQNYRVVSFGLANPLEAEFFRVYRDGTIQAAPGSTIADDFIEL